MMIKKTAEILNYNPFEPKNSNMLICKPVEIYDGIDENKKTVSVYFDAALSRKIVENKGLDARFVYIKENNEIVYFIYDGKTFSNETNFEKFYNLIYNQKNIMTPGVDIYSGICGCIYNSTKQSITAYPKNEVSIVDKEFRI